MPFLDGSSLWFDETYTAAVVDAGGLGAVWETIGRTESTPPLFYLLTWAWSQVVGDSGEATLRTVSALASIAATPVAYLALRRLVGRVPALAAAAIVTVSPVLVVYALDARSYALLVLTALLSVWAFAAVLESATGRRLALWGLAAAATIWTHYYGGFLVLAEVVVLLWLRPRARVATAAAAAAVLVALLPLVAMVREQTGDERAGFIAGTDLLERVEQLVRQFATGMNVPRTWLEALGLALFLAGGAVGLALAVRAALAARAAGRAAVGVSSAAPAPPTAAARPAAAPPAAADPDGPLADGPAALLALLAIGLAVPVALAVTGLYDRLYMRNLLYALPLCAALVALGLLRLRAIPLAAYLAVCVTAVVWAHTDWHYEQTNWRAALAAVSAADAQAGDAAPVIAATPLGQPVVTHYLRTVPASQPLSARRAWLVVEPARGPGQRALHPIAPAPAEAELAALFPQRREREVDGFRVVEYVSPTPVALAPGVWPGATLFEPAP
nr:glycosyltransferase family 39 protein [Conexibacter arvalis]